MSQINTLLIADDHPIFRKGLMDLLQHSFPKVKIIECHNGAEAIDGILKQKPDIAILDINMPEANGLDVCKRVIKEQSTTKIIILTMYQEKEMIKNAMLSGAMGYILKDNAVDEIMDCVNTVANGENYIGTAMLPYHNELSIEDKKKQQLVEGLKALSQAELKTLKLVSQNKTSKEISELLFLSEKTVENYRSRICQKLELPPRNNSLVIWISENKELLSYISEF
ncbi:MAG: response regulator transcription factor [Bacteroidetes bacterium]|jgi:DNA-binding NarL/FixJ family response regulator|nr:response regulator transcription factor [Bacteroidota bacterium]